MSKFQFSLTDAFDACRKIFNPTPEERAERAKKNEISGLMSDLNLAAYGVKVVPPTKDEIMNWGVRSASAYGVIHLPHTHAPLVGEEKQQVIEDLSGKLLALGVEQSTIDDVFAKAEEALRNPREHDIPPSF